MRSFLKDSLKVRTFPSRGEMGAAAAADAAALIRSLLKEKEEINMIFAAAPSQDEFLSAFAKEELDFSRINCFHMDEYIGLEKGHPASFGAYLDKHIFSLRPFKSVHYLNGLSADPEEACRIYEKLLREYPTDIVFMGIGENGHIAFNDPGVADFDDARLVKIAKLDETCRNQQVHDLCFPELSAVPEYAMTVTVPGLMRAAHHFCVVPGARKAEAVCKTVRGKIGAACPATALRKAPDATMYLDEDSAKLL